MKKIAIALLLPLCSVAALAQTSKKPVAAKKTTTAKSTPKPIAKPVFKSTLDSASYSFGITMASNMKKDGLNAINYDLMMQGMKDAFNDKPFALTTQGSQSAINNLFVTLSKKKFGPAIAEGTAFLENNKKQPGVQVTASGLQYQVITKGTGIMPKATDSVLVHYKGTLLNGKQFDSSYDRNEPISFLLNGVIAGWTEGVQLMPAGSKYKFFIPYNLAYGERGAGQDIPPYSTLVFEIELLKVNGK
jgi:FKBP-type peptidyl-prolyl cis-trans isomerase FklB